MEGQRSGRNLAGLRFFWPRYLALVAIIALFPGTSRTEGMKETANVRFVFGEWVPYTGAALPGFGIASEIVSAACKAAGITAEYDFFPWKRAEQSVIAGEHFATFPYLFSETRLAHYYFSDVLFTSGFSVLSYANGEKMKGFSYSSATDLKGRKVIINVGSDALKERLVSLGASVIEAASTDKGLLMLQFGRADAMVDDRAVLHRGLVQSFTPEHMRQFRFADNSFGDRSEYRILVSRSYPGSKAILERINGGLEAIKKSGEYGIILKKYGMQ